MSDINIVAEGISIQLEFVNVDPGDPSSMCWRISLELSHATGHFSYCADDIWLETEMWDAFVSDLTSGPRHSARLYDLSNYFTLNIERQNRCFEVDIAAHEPVVRSGGLQLRGKLSVELDSGLIEKLHSGFAGYPKFW
ncbi:hypothetical protein [Rhizobium rhizogenes]|jgi:hypothetical protein|nr:hypothetical protein [Rhizobium rhizogenes]NTG43586.1 hypothetical protein [Rhizobium rhizogenes]NTG68776.1 hypothetical protein [Rhizobium rhizogenes]NTG91124.1 hypothetical protein [Rhizobium rhizogenes]NTI82567.1 hypothetical protein [Rhizobium rhizogenes]NTJ24749.1 hypothetical protein [Rhizobium rhizogenes]